MDEILRQLRDDHKNFDHGSLEGHFGNEPFHLFAQWYTEAFTTNQPEPNALSVSTVDAENRPSSRIVYLKELVDDTFVFYTNYLSAKGKEIAKNPVVALVFFPNQKVRTVKLEAHFQHLQDDEYLYIGHL